MHERAATIYERLAVFVEVGGPQIRMDEVGHVPRRGKWAGDWISSSRKSKGSARVATTLKQRFDRTSDLPAWTRKFRTLRQIVEYVKQFDWFRAKL